MNQSSFFHTNTDQCYLLYKRLVTLECVEITLQYYHVEKLCFEPKEHWILKISPKPTHTTTKLQNPYVLIPSSLCLHETTSVCFQYRIQTVYSVRNSHQFRQRVMPKIIYLLETIQFHRPEKTLENRKSHQNNTANVQNLHTLIWSVKKESACLNKNQPKPIASKGYI